MSCLVEVAQNFPASAAAVHHLTVYLYAPHNFLLIFPGDTAGEKTLRRLAIGGSNSEHCPFCRFRFFRADARRKRSSK